MNARQAHRILQLVGSVDAPTRDGEVLEVRGRDGASPYFVRWADGFLCRVPCPVPLGEGEGEGEQAKIAHAEVIQLSDLRSRRALRP